MLITATHRSARWQPLRVSLWVALFFVIGRVIFRVVFGGASGSGSALPSIARIDLPGFFSSVHLFGPVTLGGISQSVMTAVPVAAFIVASGLLFSLIDIRRLLLRTRRWGGGTASLSAVLIALAVLPQLRQTAARRARARRLRARRPGLSGTIAPLVGSTVERASALAASLEARGFLNASRLSEPDCAAPVRAQSLSLRLENGRLLLRDVTFTLTPGTLTLVTGATGAGKTTLLRAMTGLFESFDHGTVTGDVSLGGINRRGLSARATADFVAYVPQDVRSSFAGVSVAEEIGLVLALRGQHRDAIDARVSLLAREMRLSHLLERPVDNLSTGEATLVALAAALVGEPSIVLIDEPFADLDEDALGRVAQLLARLAHETGITFVIAEHRTERLQALAHARLHISDGNIERVDVTAAIQVAAREVPQPDKDASPVLAVVGPNGSGKTSLLWKLALPRGALAPGVRLVPDNPVDLFDRESVAEECRAQDARQKRASHTIRTPDVSSLHVVSSLLGSTVDLNAHPRDLSTGQQRALAIALQLQSRPQYLLIDEPTRGLDDDARYELVALLARVRDRGTQVVIATHDHDFVRLLDARVIPVALAASVSTVASLSNLLPAAPSSTRGAATAAHDSVSARTKVTSS
ncbi:MAG: ATP-binding cassette domain-containing protein [Actinobacteria bacterium]|uniref:Unannotated protein n=1 Tax=freshwater metagenome TaxID=449393 RepID=A0A6J7FII2_9ZZZZ|nr:ATP-binding cassette domain-containing protein [Actinomycetota bacterium]